MIADNFDFVIFNRAGIFEDFAPDASPHEKDVIFAMQGFTALAALTSHAAMISEPNIVAEFIARPPGTPGKSDANYDANNDRKK